MFTHVYIWVGVGIGMCMYVCVNNLDKNGECIKYESNKTKYYNN